METEILRAVAEQLLSKPEVEVSGKKFRVSRTGKNRLRTARFAIDGHEYQAIEQNPEKPSRWGKLASEGHRVVQFRDLESSRYIAAFVDGKVIEYKRK